MNQEKATFTPPEAATCPTPTTKANFFIALTPKQVTEHYPQLTESEGVLANWRTQKKGPKYYKVGNKILYRPTDIEDYMFSCPVLTIDSVR
ncbi:MAG: hypothetical protein A4E66_00845 [Syntrophus sp. PtaB.Bin001]|nr:MAG: hypothetical protein A4E66_00845 [Syntrophus sp. PtaB.Bin001]